MILLVIKLPINLQKYKEAHHKIVQKELKQKKQDLIEKYRKKDIHTQKDGSKLLIL